MIVLIDVAGHQYQVSVRHREGGDDLFVFVHGLGRAKEGFDAAWDADALSGASLLSFDLIGTGGSTAPEGFSYTIEEHAAVLGGLLRQFYAPRVHLVVHSLGGAIGLMLDDDLLGSLATFVNVEGNLIGADCGVSRRIVGAGLDLYCAAWSANLLRDSGDDGPYVAVNENYPRSVYKTAESLVAWSDGGALLDRYRQLSCPTCYLYGDKNRDMPVLEQLADARIVEISKSGHTPFRDNPTEFYTVLAEVML